MKTIDLLDGWVLKFLEPPTKEDKETVNKINKLVSKLKDWNLIRDWDFISLSLQYQINKIKSSCEIKYIK